MMTLNTRKVMMVCIVIGAMFFMFASCMRVVNTVPTTKQLFKRYQFSETDLRLVDFHVSNRIVFKITSENYSYNPGRSFDLIDDRQDDVYYIEVETAGKYYEKQSKKDGLEYKKWFKIKRINLDIVSVRYWVRGLDSLTINFIENKDGYFTLMKDKKGLVETSKGKLVCVDGCSSLLLVRAHERDRYRGIDHQPYWDILFKSFLIFITIFGVLYFYSEM